MLQTTWVMVYMIFMLANVINSVAVFEKTSNWIIPQYSDDATNSAAINSNVEIVKSFPKIPKTNRKSMISDGVDARKELSLMVDIATSKNSPEEAVIHSENKEYKKQKACDYTSCLTDSHGTHNQRRPKRTTGLFKRLVSHPQIPFNDSVSLSSEIFPYQGKQVTQSDSELIAPLNTTSNSTLVFHENATTKAPPSESYEDRMLKTRKLYNGMEYLTIVIATTISLSALVLYIKFRQEGLCQRPEECEAEENEEDPAAAPPAVPPQETTQHL